MLRKLDKRIRLHNENVHSDTIKYTDSFLTVAFASEISQKYLDTASVTLQSKHYPKINKMNLRNTNFDTSAMYKLTCLDCSKVYICQTL